MAPQRTDPSAPHRFDGSHACSRWLPGKHILQAVVLVAAIVPVAAGAWGAISALDEGAMLSSHARYVSGLLFAIGLSYWSTLPHIEEKTERFRLLTVLVVIGGLCRLAGVVAGDVLSLPTAAALVMELLVTPSLCLWQSQYVPAR